MSLKEKFNEKELFCILNPVLYCIICNSVSKLYSFFFYLAPLKVNLWLPDILKAFVDALLFFSDAVVQDSKNS